MEDAWEMGFTETESCGLTVVPSKRSKMKVIALLLMPMKRLIHDKETYAVLGTLNMKDMGYIMGVTDQLREKESKKASVKHQWTSQSNDTYVCINNVQMHIITVTEDSNIVIYTYMYINA